MSRKKASPFDKGWLFYVLVSHVSGHVEGLRGHPYHYEGVYQYRCGVECPYHYAVGYRYHCGVVYPYRCEEEYWYHYVALPGEVHRDHLCHYVVVYPYRCED
ncbi:hypothetical protein GCM10028808_65060 [Spirosoma migulaei]